MLTAPAIEAAVADPIDSRSIALPGGLFDSAGGICRRVQVRALTGADEEVLFERNTGTSASARVTAFLARAIAAVDGLDRPVDERLTAAMLLGDRDYLLLRLRQIELGDAVHQVVRCHGCAQKVDVDFLISELPVRRLPDPQPAYPVSLGGNPAVVRLPNGADQDAIEALAHANPAAANTRLFSRIVLDIDGRAPSEEEVRGWPMHMRRELAAWLEARSPGPDLSLDLACPYCKADVSYAFDLHAFFLPSGWRASTS
jgi:hypothetical protein